MAPTAEKRANPSSPPDPKRTKVDESSLKTTNAKFSWDFLIPEKWPPQKEEGINETNNRGKHNNAAHPRFGKDDPKPEEGTERPSLNQQRAAMQFPDTFDGLDKKGKPPVILVPPTGCYAGSAYEHNIAKQLLKWGQANPMWINVPGAMANWSWINAEYVAYAIHYVYNLTRKKQVTLIAWSQGNLACQWALTFWPSTHSLVKNFISISADFRGTITAYAASAIPTAPSIINQRYHSHFIRAMQAKGGRSAWVPHTSIYTSVFDEVVQPQGLPSLWPKFTPSAFLDDAHKKGAVNIDTFKYATDWVYFHGSLVFHPMVWDIIKGCITKGRPPKEDEIKPGSPRVKAVIKQWHEKGLEHLNEEDIGKSLMTMSRFIPNLMHWHDMHWIIEKELPDYAKSKDTHTWFMLAQKQEIPEMSEEEKKVVAIAKKNSRYEENKHDAKSQFFIPSLLDPAWTYRAFYEQMTSGRDVMKELKDKGLI